MRWRGNVGGRGLVYPNLEFPITESPSEKLSKADDGIRARVHAIRVRVSCPLDTIAS